MVYNIACFVGCYLVGAVPTGYWFTKLFFGVDVTRHGSGNIGATNVARVLKSNKYFVLVFLIDFCKAYGALFVAALFVIQKFGAFSVSHQLFMALALLLGNGYSIFLLFKGGKGVATSFGILAFVAPLYAGIFLALFFPVYLSTSRVDVAALSSMLFATALYLLPVPRFDFSLAPLFLFMVCWMFYRHRDNLRSLLQE